MKILPVLLMALVALVALAAILVAQSAAGTTVIDFESPPVAGQRLLDPFLDPGTGVLFSASREMFPDSAVGLVWNQATSACVGPIDDDQKLGVGRSKLGDSSIGRSAAAITASFPSPLAAPIRISVEVQAPLFQVVRLRLFDDTGAVVGSATQTVASASSPSCGGPGLPRERVTVLAESSRPVSRAVIDLVGGRVVFVMDHFTIESGRP